MSISSIVAYSISVTMAVGFAARPKTDDFTHEEASLPSWMASESGSSAKAHAPPPPKNLDPQSSVDGFDWSRSAPSTIPSQTVEDYGMAVGPVPVQGESRAHYPPLANGAPKVYEDCSTLTWDPG